MGFVCILFGHKWAETAQEKFEGKKYRRFNCFRCNKMERRELGVEKD
ncbi:MAG: hypothetical protein GTN80_09025 [Nitrososphaeria archaeon]|nr:hypothetical protein [Nitrososphaeria archaeon]NIN53308.1 hypothetical protein [Nitrososphaeria archaeon]NIQ33761.1 hypothetical protein [Nitrososphaeria archaeon]